MRAKSQTRAMENIDTQWVGSWSIFFGPFDLSIYNYVVILQALDFPCLGKAEREEDD